MDQRIQQERIKYLKYLEASGFRLTKGRGEVFEQVMQTHGHFAAEELVKGCKQCGRSVSRATIYRSLKELLEAGVIRETAFGEKHQHFEHVYDEKLHHHARCVRCGVFLEFEDLGEEQRYKSILDQKGFHVLGHELHFYGICAECNQQNLSGAKEASRKVSQ